MTVTIVLSLAVALGVTTAALTITDDIFFKPLPYPDAARLVRIDGVFTRLPLRMTETGLELTAPLEASDLANAPGVSAIGMYASSGVNAGSHDAERLRAAAVTPGFFEALDVPPRIGRVFSARDARPADRVIILSARLWRQSFDGDTHIVERSFELNGRPYRIVGVMPDGFDFPAGSDLWFPAGADPQIAAQLTPPAFVARLRPGVTIATAKDQLLQIASAGVLTRQEPGAPTLRVTPLGESLTSEFRSVALLLASAALLVLLIACLNSSHLLVASVQTHERDFAVRRALGATVAQIVVPVVCEAALLTLAGAALATAAAAITLTAARAFLQTIVFHSLAVQLTPRSIAILVLLSLGTTALLAAAPIVAAIRTSTTLLPSRLTPAQSPRRLGSVLVVGQIAVSLVILVSAATIMETVRRLAAVDLGAHNDSAVVAEVALPAAAYDTSARIRAFYQQVLDSVQPLHGVIDAGFTNQAPGSNAITPALALEVEHALPPPDGSTALRLSATPGYFASLGIDTLAGRVFTDDDRADSPPVAIVSASFPKRVGLSAASVLGRRVNVSLGEKRWATVIGVVRDVRLRGPENDAGLAVYVPFTQAPPYASAFLTVRGDGSRELPAEIRRAVARVDPAVPLYNVRRLQDIRDEYLAARRFAFAMILVFGAAAFALSCIGLFAIVHYRVRRRTREIGVRMAIGASQDAIWRNVVASGACYAGAGVMAGLLAVPGATRILAAAIPGAAALSAFRVGTLAGIAFLVVTGAAWLPARSAARVDPVVALRSE